MTDRATTGLAERADRLRALHVPGDPLVLPNVWDAAGGQAVAAAGFPVVATGSAAVAEALGYADHEAAPPAEMFAAAARIAAAVPLPVTVDAEAGYGLPAGELVDALLAAGAVGCNLEDTAHAAGGLADVEAQAGWLREVRAAASTAGVPLVVNARTDVFLQPAGTFDDPVEEAVSRCRAYLAAGADCVYPILADDPADIGCLVAGVDGPVNVLARPQAPGLQELAELGVARISYGPGLYRASQAHLAAMLAEVAAGGSPFR
ncbi:MAG: isocitrate lyase/phosphoenolpyruvate mutase family protein [Streptosporangiales bacterium]|nr:isocitrate lyase/phosphoenolpyruvate mutase family protein [Streptosporangiales bacterium]